MSPTLPTRRAPSPAAVIGLNRRRRSSVTTEAIPAPTTSPQLSDRLVAGGGVAARRGGHGCRSQRADPTAHRRRRRVPARPDGVRSDRATPRTRSCSASRRTCRCPGRSVCRSACRSSAAVPAAGRPGHAGRAGDRHRRQAPRRPDRGDPARRCPGAVLRLPHRRSTTAGVYYLVVDGGPPKAPASMSTEPGTVDRARPPADPLPPFDTPTIADARGVDPICTREPEPCPFHDITLTEALAAGKRVVYYVGTPAFCSDRLACAPALESIIEVQTGVRRHVRLRPRRGVHRHTATTLGARRRGAADCSTSRRCSSPTRRAWCRAPRRRVERPRNWSKLRRTDVQPGLSPAARGQLKLWPHPQVREAFGLVMANPDWSRPSL